MDNNNDDVVDDEDDIVKKVVVVGIVDILHDVVMTILRLWPTLSSMWLFSLLW